MSEPSPRFWEVFFELVYAIPRQGPGTRECAARALAMCGTLPSRPDVLDLGCGVGGQTIQLAEMTDGTITAVDVHAPSIERLRRVVAERGLSDRVLPHVADMARLDLPPASFDLVWSEGALYQIGLDRALDVCRELLRRGGVLAFTDAVWRRKDPPPEVKASFDLDYPAMGDVPDVLATIARSGLALVGHFTLPDDAWWDDFYTPWERRIAELRALHAGDAEAESVLDRLAQEPEMHRQFASYYAYEFFVSRRVD